MNDAAPDDDPEVLVIGAGVSGLTTAVVLAEQGVRTTIWTADPPDQTTSMAAGAMWGPYLVEPADKVRKWSLQTVDVLKRLAKDERTGVRMVSGIEASRIEADPPDWAQDLDDYAPAQSDALPSGFASGVRFTAPMVEMPVYLEYLQSRFRAAGGELRIRRIDSFDEAFEKTAAVVNCAGVGARNLVPDPGVTAIRGQLVSVLNPGITEFFSEDTGDSTELLHLYPHGDTLILGGVASPDEWSLLPNERTTEAIINRCGTVFPAISEPVVIDQRVGLRPTRAAVRVTAEPQGTGLVVHNYGHGGAGVSLSWGCAEDAASLLSAWATS